MPATSQLMLLTSLSCIAAPARTRSVPADRAVADGSNEVAALRGERERRVLLLARILPGVHEDDRAGGLRPHTLGTEQEGIGRSHDVGNRIAAHETQLPGPGGLRRGN